MGFPVSSALFGMGGRSSLSGDLGEGVPDIIVNRHSSPIFGRDSRCGYVTLDSAVWPTMD